MAQWEYAVGTWKNMHQVEIEDMEKFLNNSFGDHGWELVSAAVFPEVRGYGGGGSPVSGASDIKVYTDFKTIMIFKRPK